MVGIRTLVCLLMMALTGCGKSAQEIAAERSADEASSRAAEGKAQAELDADSKKFREIATTPPKPEEPKWNGFYLSLCSQVGGCAGWYYCSLMRQMTLAEVDDVLGSPEREQGVGGDRYTYYTLPGDRGQRVSVQLVGSRKVTGCNYY